MKTILKAGQQENIYRPALGAGDFPITLEGRATLVKLVRRCHTAKQPYETWLVKFEDDDTPVSRDIVVNLPNYGMASSLARSPECINLLEFMENAGLSNDWADPCGHGVVAYVTGRVLGNDVGAVELAGSRKINDELLVHLECTKDSDANSKIILNLNTLLVMASNYIRQQYDIAAEATQVK